MITLFIFYIISMELISIVLTLYNKAPYIEETIFSIYKQTYTNWELIIVDDCSTDGSFEIAKSFCEKLWITKKCKFIQNEKNLRVAKTFERWLKEVKGDWISMCDGDDILMKNKLEENLKFCTENHVDFCYSDMMIINEYNTPSWFTLKKLWIHAYRNKFNDNICNCCAVWSSIFFSSSLGQDLAKDGFMDHMYQDWWSVLYASLKWYTIQYINHPLIYYRRCNTSITWNMYEGKEKESNQKILSNWTHTLKEENERCLYILQKHFYTLEAQKIRLMRQISLNNHFLDFLESKKLILPLTLLKQIPFVREKEFYYRLFILQARKFIQRFSTLLKFKS